MDETRKPLFVDYLLVILKRRTFVYKTFLVGFLVSTIISFILRNQYTASTTILPPNPQQDLMFGFMNPAMVSSLGGYSGLTSLLSGGTGPSDLFAAILKSSRITGILIEKYSLKKVFKVKTNHDAAARLDAITKIGVTPEGMILVSVTWFDKQLAADIANSYIEELDKFNTETAMTTGKKYRIFIEQRLKDTDATMAKAEEALRDFQKKHRTIILEDEIKSAIETVAKLKSEIILREVQKGALESFSNVNNPYVQNIDNELREFKKQLSKIEFGADDETKKEFGAGFSIPFSQLPEASLEYARLLRDVKVQELIYELMTQQYEQAKIMEVKDTPTVQVLVRASPPEKKSLPKRAMIIILASFFSLILGTIGTFVLELFDQIKKRPDDYREWIDIYGKIRSDVRNTKAFAFGILHIKAKR